MRVLMAAGVTSISWTAIDMLQDGWWPAEALWLPIDLIVYLLLIAALRAVSIRLSGDVAWARPVLFVLLFSLGHTVPMYAGLSGFDFYSVADRPLVIHGRFTSRAWLYLAQYALTCAFIGCTAAFVLFRRRKSSGGLAPQPPR